MSSFTYNAVLMSTGKSSPTASNSSLDCVCYAGFFKPTGSEACIACEAGTYKETIGDFNCTACDIGKYSNLTGSTYGANCTSCDLGATTLNSGSTHPANCTCDLGYTGLDAGINCTQCQPNRYKSTYGSAACTPCRNFSSSFAASVTAEACECNFGYEDYNGSCIFQCPSGFYASKTGDTCMVCPSATFQPQFAATNSSFCRTCGDGSYSNIASSTFTDCFCAGGYTGLPIHPLTGISKDIYKSLDLANESRADDAAVLEAAMLASANASGCLACPANHYKEGITAQECRRCPPNSTSHAATPLEYPNKYAAGIFGLSQGPEAWVRGCMCDRGFTGGLHVSCCFNITRPFITPSAVCLSMRIPGQPLHLGSSRSFPLLQGESWQSDDTPLQSGSVLPPTVSCRILLERQTGLWEHEWNKTWHNTTNKALQKAMGSFNRSFVSQLNSSQAFVCEHCAPGSYKPSNGSAPCSLCPNATYGDATAATQLDGVCLKCPDHSTSDQGSTRLTDCQCLPGETRDTASALAPDQMGSDMVPSDPAAPDPLSVCGYL
jgi:hypothetical protein